MSSSELVSLSARESVARLKSREISPLELIDAAEERIAAVDPAVNALPTLCLDRCPMRPGRAGWVDCRLSSRT